MTRYRYLKQTEINELRQGINTIKAQRHYKPFAYSREARGVDDWNKLLNRRVKSERARGTRFMPQRAIAVSAADIQRGRHGNTGERQSGAV